MTKRALFLFGLLGLMASPGLASTARHPFHVTIAEAEVALDEDGVRVLQVALRVDPDELERALTRRAERRINIESPDGVDDLIIAYLDDVFLVRHPAADDDHEPEPLAPCPPPARGEDETEREAAPATRPDEAKKKSIIRWVGKEVDIKYAWLYFEICIPDGIEGLEFSNRILFEMEPTQANTVNFIDGDWKPTLRFTRLEAWHTLKHARDE